MAEGGKKVVAAVDNMLTLTIAAGLTYRIESPTSKKLRWLTENVIVMGGGDVDALNIIITNALPRIHKGDRPKIIAEKIRDAYAEHTRDMQEKMILAPVGLNWNQFITQQNKLDTNIASDLYRRLQNFAPAGELVIAGYDTTSNEAHLCVISSGAVLDRNTLGVAFAGSGYPLANMSLTKAGFQKGMTVDEVEKIVRDAMEEARHADGVGPIGDLVIFPK